MTHSVIQAQTTKPRYKRNPQAWYRPTFSPEQGVILVLLGSFLTGAALAQSWTSSATLALICALCALQAEHPLVVQLKQRRSWKPRFLVWGGFYGSIALSIAMLLCLKHPVLFWICGGGIAAFVIDAIAVVQRQNKSVTNELVLFAAICLASPLAYGAITGTISTKAIAMWLLNTLFFSSAIFTIKLRKQKTSSLVPGMVYHAIAPLIVTVLYYLNWLSLVTALAFGVVLLKFVLITCILPWYRTAKFEFIARFETYFALLFVAIAAISVLPARLPVS